MFIQCTKKLLDRLKLKPEPRLEENPLFSWHANLVTINRRQAVVLINDKTRYAIMIYGLKAKDFSQINRWIVQAVREVFLQEGIKEEVIEHYLQDAGAIAFTKTKDRSHVARLNKATENTEVFSYREGKIDIIDGINEDLSMQVSRLLVTDGNGDYIRPNEELYHELKARYGENIFSTKAVEIKVTLMLEEHEIYRNLIVPLNRTFPQFHKILQSAFSWTNSHLHEFYILKQTIESQNSNWYHPAFAGEGYKPVLNLVSDEEAFNYPEEILDMKLDSGIKLSTFIPDFKMLVYHYDFGDSWSHKIEVIGVMDDYDKNYPLCTDGAGNAPPEDVGSEGGFTEFLHVMANPDDPNHQQIKQWVVGQGYEAFDKEKINRMLKYQW